MPQSFCSVQNTDKEKARGHPIWDNGAKSGAIKIDTFLHLEP